LPKTNDRLYIENISLAPKVDIIKQDPRRKKTSPNCDMVNTLRPALIVVTLIDQYLIKKKETTLIHSQRASMLIRSKVMKNTTAN
jgi:hypothetical protein